MKICPKCDKEHNKTGMCCSRSCSSSRKFGAEAILKKSIANKAFWNSLSEEEKRRRSEKCGGGEGLAFAQKQLSEYWKKFRLENFELLQNDAKKKVLFEERGEKCEICGITEWQNQKLVFQLDHKDGNKNHNKRENLRLVCPNCHSQTPTYNGRNQKPHNKGKKRNKIYTYTNDTGSVAQGEQGAL